MKLTILIVSGLTSLWLAAPASAVTLIKSEEAKLAPGPGVLATRGISRGPAIKLLSPLENGQVTSPFNLKIGFEARGGAQIDPAATKIIYLKSKPVDLLPRVKTALTEKGIDLADAETPPGEHQIQITVQDSEGRISNSVIQLNVVK